MGSTVVSETPASSLPIFFAGTVTRGFNRGSTELGFPTANVDPKVAPSQLEPGVYAGLARVPSVHGDWVPAALSVGWNPYYRNVEKTVEVHLLREYPELFYGEELQVVVTDWIRGEADFDSLDALISAIHADCRKASTLSNGRPSLRSMLSLLPSHVPDTVNGIVRERGEEAKR
jgi:riboflavin kinase